MKRFLVPGVLLAAVVVFASPAAAVVGPNVRCVNNSDPACSASYATIQLAVNAAFAGDVILVGPGTYNETVQIPAGKDDLSILGAKAGVNGRGRSVPVAKESTVVAAGAGSLNAGFIVQATDVMIDGFRVTGATDPGNGSGIDLKGGANPADGAQILDNIFVGNSQALSINFEAAAAPSGIVVEHNGFRNNNVGSGDGIFSSACDHLLVNENDFFGNPTAALGINNCTAVTITHNSSENDGTFAIFTGTSHGTVAYNSVTKAGRNPTPAAGGAAIAIGPSNDHLTFSHNTVNGGVAAGTRGIAVTSIFGPGASTHLMFNSNTVRSMPGSGIVADAGMLTNSRFLRNRSSLNHVDGISLATGDSGNFLWRNIARGNTAVDCHDMTIGGGTAGTSNIWLLDRGNTNSPAAICS